MPTRPAADGRDVLDRITVGHRSIDTMPVGIIDDDGLFGPGLLQRLGEVVGFNLRSRQLALYC